MSKHKTSISRYVSEFSPPGAGNEVYCSGSQLLSEKMCKRIALKEKRHIGIKFWNDSSWKNEYRKQMVQAARLIKELESEGVENPTELILKTFRTSKKLLNVYSLGLKSVIKPVCLKLYYKDKLSDGSPPPIIIPVDVTQKPRSPVGARSLKSKLEDLE